MNQDLVLVCVVGRPHGVRGLVHIHSYVEDPISLERYAPLQDEQGRLWSLRWCNTKDNVAELIRDNGEPFTNRSQVQEIINTRLYVSRSALPALEEEEFYHVDLIGMEVFEGHLSLGHVVMVHDYGGGVSLEISKGVFIPFTKACVPRIDLKTRSLFVCRPIEIWGEEKQETKTRFIATGLVS